jgi:cation diffusion facilitator CzcD-associated flavoprotein CzcO
MDASPPSQFTWARNPNWSRYYSSSEEIWQYFKDISVKYDLERYIRLNTTVESATWNEPKGKWKLSLLGPDGSHFEDSCDILINGSGVLKFVSLLILGLATGRLEELYVLTTVGNNSSWKFPKIPGLDLYQGKLMHSAKWDSKHDLTGKTVAVVGGGSSAVQIIPSIQPSEFEKSTSTAGGMNVYL